MFIPSSPLNPYTTKNMQIIDLLRSGGFIPLTRHSWQLLLRYWKYFPLVCNRPNNTHELGQQLTQFRSRRFSWLFRSSTLPGKPRTPPSLTYLVSHWPKFYASPRRSLLTWSRKARMDPHGALLSAHTIIHNLYQSRAYLQASEYSYLAYYSILHALLPPSTA